MPLHVAASDIDPALDQRIRDRVKDIPIMLTMDIRIDRIQDGVCTITAPRKPGFDGIYESFQGGLLMAAADIAACFAVMSKTDIEGMLTTTDMNIRFLAPCLTDVTATATLIKLGRTLCPTTVDLHDASGKLVAIAQVTYMRLPGIPNR